MGYCKSIICLWQGESAQVENHSLPAIGVALHDDSTRSRYGKPAKPKPVSVLARQPAERKPVSVTGSGNPLNANRWVCSRANPLNANRWVSPARGIRWTQTGECHSGSDNLLNSNRWVQTPRGTHRTQTRNCFHYAGNRCLYYHSYKYFYWHAVRLYKRESRGAVSKQ